MRSLTWPFRLSGPVRRGPYAAAGFGLALVKYVVDAGAISHFAHMGWGPRQYLSPMFDSHDEVLERGPAWLGIALAAWTLPFLWIGLALTIRRTLDAGLSPWLGLVFLVPILNYGLMLLLCALPSRERTRGRADSSPAAVDRRLRSALMAVGISVAGTAVMTLLAIYVLRGYGMSLFLGMPVLLGVTAGYVHNEERMRGVGDTILVAFVATGVSMGGLLIFALEGAICLVMAAPLLFGGAVLGALAGRGMAYLGARPGLPGVALVPLLFFSAAGEAHLARPVHIEVASATVIDAPPERVWEHVVAFGELPPPTWRPFDLGVAYPVRARIDGEGVGAVRHCEFSTGAFVEPITAWEPPRRLAFDVAEQPPPMRELTPYPGIDPPHLDGFVRCLRGEFRLVDLGDGRTRLEGSTWYELEIFPAAYWRPWADMFIARIHDRVLAHVKNLAEATPVTAGGD